MNERIYRYEINGQLYRAELGIDGDHAYALVGPNLQEGEAEFFPLSECSTNEKPEIIAQAMALKKLKERLGVKYLDFYIKGV